MRCVGQTFEAAGVRRVYLVHGTFAGTDAFGLIRDATRRIPGLGRALGSGVKRLTDAVLGETANYTPQYAELFERSMAPAESARPAIDVRISCWSSENHHIGRANAAICLLDELQSLAQTVPERSRALVWGHSHAGNVLALTTLLIAADKAALEQFFAAAQPFYCRLFSGKIDVPVWQRVRDALLESDRTIDRLAVDIVTFGTPIRYGWNASGCARLLHFVNHRPAEGLPPYQAPFPPRLLDVLHATHGDYIQQLGIAGTNIAPSILTCRTWLADRRLGRLLQCGASFRELARNLASGLRVPDGGTTLLVDYGDAGDRVAHHIAGHAVYTRREWLLFHAEEVCRRFYGNAAPLEFTL